MATAPNEVNAQRRMLMRRARGGGSGRGGFSSGSSTQTEGGYQGEPDEVDEIIDNPDPGERVRRNVPALSPPSTRIGPDDEPDSHRNRELLAQATMAGDAKYAKEMRLNLMFKLQLRGVSLQTIAQELGVSIHTAQKYRAELGERLRQDAKELNIDEIIGRQNAFYNEAEALALRVVSAQGTPGAMKLAGIRTALAANADRTRFMSSAGVFDVLQFRRADDGSSLSDIQMLMKRTEEMMANLDSLDELDEGSAAAPAKKVVRRKRSGGGFKPHSFDDPDASNSTDETVDL